VTELLHLRDVKKYFGLRGTPWQKAQAVRAVDGVSVVVRKGETLGLVGESGSGKSTLARVATRLLDPTQGRVEIGGKDVTNIKGRRLRPIRRQVQMVFQDPQASLNPRQSVATILSTPFRAQGIRPTRAQLVELLEQVGLSEQHLERYPHEFSGGQRQRIGIARALALQPKLIVCDEPVSALDVSIQAQVVNLLEDLQEEYGLGYVFIAHDLSVVRHISDRVAVMYLGKIMETAERDVLYSAPQHPYTHSLMSAVPVPDPDKEKHRERLLLTGDLPSPINPPSGCVFHTRCPLYRSVLDESQRERCRSVVPELGEVEPGHRVHCHFPTRQIDVTAGAVNVNGNRASADGLRSSTGPAAASAPHVPDEQRP
jgi:peptide/nickel transport system ATP-binding protein